MPIHLLLLYWAVSTLRATVSEYASALKVAESNSHFPRAPYVGHKCMGIAKYQKLCWIITQTQPIFLVFGKEYWLWIIIWSMNWSWCYIAYSLWKVPNCSGVHFNYSNSNNSCNSTSNTHSLNRISCNERNKKGKTSKKQPNPIQRRLWPFHHKKILGHHTFPVAMKLAAIQVSKMAVTEPGPPVHSVQPAGICSDTVYDAPPPPPCLLAIVLSRGHAIGLSRAKLSTAQWYQKTVTICIKAACGALVGNSTVFAHIGMREWQKARRSDMKKRRACLGSTQLVHWGREHQWGSSYWGRKRTALCSVALIQGHRRSDSSTPRSVVSAHSYCEAVVAVILFNFLLCRAVVILKPKGKPAQVFWTN